MISVEYYKAKGKENIVIKASSCDYVKLIIVIKQMIF